MPYKTNSDLPDSVKENIPAEAQETYRKTFNSAWETYKDPEKRRGNDTREEAAHQVAWAAVKHQFKKDEETGTWKKK